MRNVIMYAFRLTIGKMIEMSFLDNYKRVVIKIGSSTLTHAETGSLNFSKMERLVRSICEYRNSGMDVCLVSSGAIAVGRDRHKGAPERHFNKAGMRRSGTGQADDDISEAFF